MPSFSKAIGIVGGAGPMASNFLYKTIIEVCQKQYKANDYNEFPEIILVSYPFSRGNREKIETEIKLCLSKLKAAGANLFCIASNSFHGFLPDISNWPFVHLIEEALLETSRLKISKALILAAQGTIDLKLYEQAHLKCLYPFKEDQKKIDLLIREVAGGTINIHQSTELKRIIAHCYQQTPFDGIILACTELPLIHQNFSLSEGERYPSMPVIDTIAVLARRLVELALK